VHRARSAIAIAALKEQVDRRTGSQVTDARHRLRNWIVAAIIGMTATVLLALRGVRSVRQKVLRPIEDMCAVTDQLARGQYDVRLTGEDEVQEIQTLRTTFNSMADAIERDIDERESIGRELQEARARAEAATQAKSLFLANMSHEIRTPLNAVIGMADLLLRSRLPPRQRDYASKIRISGRALLDTLNDILDFSKIEAGRLELERIPFRLEDLVANAFVLVERAALERASSSSSSRAGTAPRCSPAVSPATPCASARCSATCSPTRSSSPRRPRLAAHRAPACHRRAGTGALQRRRHRHRPAFRPDRTPLRRLRAGRRRHHPPLRRHRAGAGHRAPAGRGDGRDDPRQERAGPGQPLHRRDPPVPRRRRRQRPAEALPALRVLVADDYPEARLALIDVLQLAGLDDVEAVSCGSELFDCLAGPAARAAPTTCSSSTGPCPTATAAKSCAGWPPSPSWRRATSR
jgi:HAMP domain-containing protein